MLVIFDGYPEEARKDFATRLRSLWGVGCQPTPNGLIVDSPATRGVADRLLAELRILSNEGTIRFSDDDDTSHYEVDLRTDKATSSGVLAGYQIRAGVVGVGLAKWLVQHRYTTSVSLQLPARAVATVAVGTNAFIRTAPFTPLSKAHVNVENIDTNQLHATAWYQDGFVVVNPTPDAPLGLDLDAGILSHNTDASRAAIRRMGLARMERMKEALEHGIRQGAGVNGYCHQCGARRNIASTTKLKSTSPMSDRGRLWLANTKCECGLYDETHRLVPRGVTKGMQIHPVVVRVE